MVQLTSSVERSFLEDGKEIIEFRTPGISEDRARSNALFAARVKGMEDAQVTDIENVGSSGIPGRDLFSVTVEAPR